MVNKFALSALSALFLTTLIPEKVEGQIQPHYHYSYPTYYHSVLSVGRSGKMIELEDDSGWQIQENSCYEASQWYAGDPLVISPGVKQDEYFITNVARNRYVPATLVQGPKNHNPNTCEIVHIDHYTGYVEMRTIAGNLLRWRTDPQDRKQLFRWAPGNKIILGANDGWWASWLSDYNAVLIGVENYPDCIRAKLY
jgi:hypothetical protein